MIVLTIFTIDLDKVGVRDLFLAGISALSRTLRCPHAPIPASDFTQHDLSSAA
jgi:hypothetical protein